MQSGFRHRPGTPCGFTALRDLSDPYGWGLDEAECFGPGAGIGAGYGAAGPAARIVMGRSAHLETAFFDHLGIDVSRRAGQARAAAWDDLATRADAAPVLVFVDLGYLPYFGTDTHFGPHTVLVTAVDEDAVRVADSEFEDVQTVDRDAFDAAWSSEQGFGPLDREWLAVEDPAPTVSVETATRDAVALAARTMCEAGTAWGTQGVAGIRDFAAALPSWNDLPDPRWTARFAYQTIERRGTGGGAFRRLYADFLASLGVDAGLDPSLADRMRAVADDWTALAGTLKQASEAADPERRAGHFEDAGEQASAIAEAEAALFADLGDRD